MGKLLVSDNKIQRRINTELPPYTSLATVYNKWLHQVDNYELKRVNWQSLLNSQWQPTIPKCRKALMPLEGIPYRNG